MDRVLRKKSWNSLIWEGFGWAPPELQYFLFYKRDWKTIREFYKDVVIGNVSFSQSLGLDLEQVRRSILDATNKQEEQHIDKKAKGIPNEGGDVATGKTSAQQSQANATSKKRQTYRVLIRFYGHSFEGSSFVKGLITVEQVLRKRLQQLCPGERVSVNGAGRTDKGVSAAGYAFSFFSWKDLTSNDIIDAVNDIAPDSLRAFKVDEVPRKFHGSFSVEWRRYVFLFPLKSEFVKWGEEEQEDLKMLASEYDRQPIEKQEVDVPKICRMLKALEGKELDYFSFARDTPKGKSTVLTLMRAHACTVQIPKKLNSTDNSPPLQALCVELVGQRFLRKMVRVLVATAIRESMDTACGLDVGDEVLVEMCARKDRLLTAPAIVPDGLCFAGVGYQDKIFLY